MARSPPQFLLFRLAAQNIGRRRLRALLLGLAVMLAVGVAFASFTGGWALRGGVVTSFSRMGADIVVVPIGTLVNITSTLLTVQPTDQELDAGLADRLRATAATPTGSEIIGLSTVGVAMLALVFVWASTLLMLLKGSAVLAFLLWVGVTVSRQFGRDPRPHVTLGDKVRAFTRGALRRSLLVPLVILGLVVASSLAPAYLILPALVVIGGGTIALRRLAAVVRGTADGRLDPVHRPRVARASGANRGPIARAKPSQIRLPELIDTGCDRDQAPEEPVELRISFFILRHSDQNEAARLAIKAVTGMIQAHATPAPTFLQWQTADGGAILEVRFHVRDVRRGSEHVLDEAESRLWDLLHEQRIPYALRPRQAMSREAYVV